MREDTAEKIGACLEAIAPWPGGAVTAAERRRRNSAVLSVEQAAQVLGIGRRTAYDQVRDGTFPFRVVRAGRRVLVVREDVERQFGADTVAAVLAREEGG